MSVAFVQYDYEVLSEEYLSELVKEVRKYIQDGWSPQGGISYGGERFLQAMVKKQ